MKYFVFLLSYLFVQAQPSPQVKSLECITQMPTTSFLFYVLDDKKAKLTVVHHNGIEYAPLHNGVTTGYIIGILQDRLKYVTKMGEHFEVEFDLKNCHLEKGNIACSHPGKAKIGELSVDDYYFGSYDQTNKTAFGEFSETVVSFKYRVKAWPHEMSMNFHEGECQ